MSTRNLVLYLPDFSLLKVFRCLPVYIHCSRASDVETGNSVESNCQGSADLFFILGYLVMLLRFYCRGDRLDGVYSRRSNLAVVAMDYSFLFNNFAVFTTPALLTSTRFSNTRKDLIPYVMDVTTWVGPCSGDTFPQSSLKVGLVRLRVGYLTYLT